MLFHAGVTAFAGGYVGVDVFFVISGFLITGILIDEIGRTGTVSISSFYARRARRILPISTLVLLVTLGAGFLVLSPIDHGGLISDARASALFVSNWHSIGQAGNYFAADIDRSFLLHYWSLAIEEQFYFVWPWLLFGAARLSRRRPELRLRRIAIILGIVVGASLAASILLTDRLGVVAYYGTPLRIWELGVGAGLAFARPWLRTWSGAVRAGASATGVAAILIAATTFDATTSFPGSAALLPVMGSALVLAAGVAGPLRWGRVLAAGPLPAIGRVSYAWYLWHWPLLAIVGVLRVDLGWTISKGAAVSIAVAASFLLAVVSHRLVERPIRFTKLLVHHPRRTFAVAAALTVLPLAATAIIPPAATQAVASDRAGAMTPQWARRDNPAARAGHCHLNYAGDTVHPDCNFGLARANKTMVLIGDSHALQWMPAYRQVALANGWRLFMWTKAACSVLPIRVFVEALNREYVECVRWRANLMSKLRQMPRIDMLIMGPGRGLHRGTLASGSELPESGEIPIAWDAASRASFNELVGLADRLVIMRSIPIASQDPVACLSRNLNEPDRCVFNVRPRVRSDVELFLAEWWEGTTPLTLIDPQPWVCARNPCPVITPDGTIVYRDQDHLTATFSRSLAVRLARELKL